MVKLRTLQLFTDQSRGQMKEIIRSTNWVLVGRVRSVLEGQGIEAFHFDFNASAVEGSIGALPQRILVTDEDEPHARRLIRDVGLGDELVDEGKS